MSVCVWATLFMVMATQNPIESTGTYELPESQLDRFLMRLSMGYPGPDEELELLRTGGAEPELEQLEPVLSAAEVIELQSMVAEVHTDEKILAYLMEVITRTREHDALSLGVSTRGSLAWQRSAQALALDVLVGRRPGSAEMLPDSLPQLPSLDPVPLGLPAALLDRRPDLRQAEMQLAAAQAMLDLRNEELNELKNGTRAEELDQARAAFELDEVPVGAVIVYGQRVIGAAHNLCQQLRQPLPTRSGRNSAGNGY